MHGARAGVWPLELEVEVLKPCRERRGGLKLVLDEMWEDTPASGWTF